MSTNTSEPTRDQARGIDAFEKAVELLGDLLDPIETAQLAGLYAKANFNYEQREAAAR